MLSGGLRTKGIHKHTLPNEPLITVVTVVRNGESTLEETILSVLNQTYRNVEYIVIDGASTDGTVGIIKKYEDRIDYWLSESDKGIYDAMNKGIDLAAGEWINFINGGDRFVNSEILAKIFSRDCPESSIEDSRRNRIGVLYGDIYKNTVSEGSRSRWIPFFEKKYKIKRMGISHQAIFTRTELAKELHFDLSYTIAADYDMMTKIYNKNYLFKKIDFPVAVCNMSGFSAHNRILQCKEEAQICGMLGKPIYYLYLLLTYTKEILKAGISLAGMVHRGNNL